MPFSPAPLPPSLLRSAMHEPVHRAHKAALLLDFGRARGLAAEVMLAGCGLDADALLAPQTRLSVVQYLRLCDNARQASRDPLFAFELGRDTRVERLGLFGSLLRSCSSLADTLAVTLEFRALTMPVLLIEHGGEGADLIWQFSDILGLPAPLLSFLVDLQIGVQLALQDDVLGQPLTPRWCSRTEAPPAHAADLAKALGCEVRWGQPRCLLAFAAPPAAAAWGRRPSVGAAELRAAALSELEQLRRAGGLGAQVERQLALSPRAAPAALPGAAQVALALGLSERSLRRRLQAEGQSFQGLLDAHRRQRAGLLLADPALSIEAVSERLGFADPSSFRQAFKRWTGRSPRAHRQGTGAAQPSL